MREPFVRHMWGPGLFELLILALIIGGAIVLIVTLTRNRPPMPGPSVAPPTKDLAVETLRMRYAKGEITQEEFKAMSSDLGGVDSS